MNLLFEYIKYRWNAKGRHGVHSPFVYDLVDKGFKIAPKQAFVENRLKLFKALKHNSKVIDVADFGAGSRFFDNKRRISAIFKRSASRGKKGVLLHQLVAHFQPKTILELGTSLGIGTFSLASGSSDGEVISVEACPNTFKEAKKNIETCNLTNVKLVNSLFTDFLNAYQGPKFDFVFVDGHHDGKALLSYLHQLEKLTHDETIFLLDDIRWSKSMKDAFDTIVKSQEYHVTIDLFQVAIVVKREHQTKEHFVLSYF